MTTKKSTDKKKNYSEQISSLKKEIEKLKCELKEKNDKLLRSIADFQNLQKRIEKEIDNCVVKTKEKYLSELIDLHELLKKAFYDENPKEGLKLINNNIEYFFKKEGIKSINCIGEKFDHNLHHAVTTVENNECEDNTIIEEIKKGFILNDKVIRPSHVIVSKKKEK
jgi:molecular chaperone GrpE